MKKRTILAGAAALAVAASAASEPTTLRLHDQWMAVDPGDEYCQFSEEREEGAVIDLLRRMNKGKNELIAVFAPCADITAYRLGLRGFVTRIVLMTPYVGGELLTFPLDDRHEFLKAYKKIISMQTDASRVEPLRKEAERRMRQEKPSMTILPPVILGLLDTDDVAVYHGTLVQSKNDGRIETEATVVAATLVGRYVVMATISRPYVDETTISELVEQIRPVMASIAIASAPLGMGRLLPVSPAFAASSGSSLQGLIDTAVIGALLGLLGWGIVALARRTRGRRQAKVREEESASC